MRLFQELRGRARHIVWPVLCACLIIYAGYHALQGDRGLKAWSALNQKIVDAKAKRATATDTRKRLELRVSMLRERSLDLDLLEERARWTLNLSRRGDIVIMYGRPIRKPRN